MTASQREPTAGRTIGMLHYAPFPWNRGIHLVASALQQSGHEVTVYCPEGRFGRSAPAAVRVVRYASGTRLPVYADPRWLAWLVRRLREDRTDIIWARDLPMMPFALAAGALLRRPVCFDMRENFPAAFLARRRERQSILRRAVHRGLRLLERLAVRRAAHVFVVIDEQKDRLVAAGVPPGRITINVTTPDAAFLAAAPPPAAVAASTGAAAPATRPLRVVYSGHFFAFRGLDMVLHAVADARGRGADVRLTLAGGEGRGDEQMLERLQAASARLGIDDAVETPGWVTPEDVPGFLARFDVGVIANEVSEHTETTIPGKLFEYMAAGLIVISSDLAPVRRIVQQEAVGYIFRPYDADALCECLLAVADLSAEQRQAMRARSWEAARSTYNWEQQSRTLVRVVENL